MKYLIALLALAGIYVSVMALRVHYMDPSQAPPCAVTEKFDCGAVNHSRFAVFPPRSFDEPPTGGKHIPIAALGIVAYSVIAVLALMGRWWLLAGVSQLVFLFAGFLSYLEAFVLEKWCIYCLWSQTISAVVLLLMVIVLLVRWWNSKSVGVAV